MCWLPLDCSGRPLRPSRSLTRRNFLCVAGPFVALPWFAGLARAETPSPATAAALPVKEIADGVFVHHGVVDMMRASNEGGIANIGFIVGTEAVAVIDSGGSVLEGAQLIAAISKTTDKPIRYVVNTHMHPDHLFANAAFADGSSTFVGHRNLSAALAARRESYLTSNLELMGADLMADISIIAPTLTVDDEVTLALGDRDLKLRAWPTAHTNNDVTVIDEKTRTLFTGDLVFQDHCPTLDGSILGWMKVLEDLTTIGADRVVPGHGPVNIAWPDGADAQKRYLKVLAGDLRRLIAKGVPLADAIKTAGRSEEASWQLFDEYNPRNATAAYAELEWE